jgi:hypothetical protein
VCNSINLVQRQRLPVQYQLFHIADLKDQSSRIKATFLASRPIRIRNQLS